MAVIGGVRSDLSITRKTDGKSRINENGGKQVLMRPTFASADLSVNCIRLLHCVLISV